MANQGENQPQTVSPRRLFSQKKSSDALKPSQQNSQTGPIPALNAGPTDSNLSFKQFKQKTGLCNLKDLQRKIDIINSRQQSKGVTPSGNVPLPSTSNFLVGATGLALAGVPPEVRPNQ